MSELTAQEQRAYVEARWEEVVWTRNLEVKNIKGDGPYCTVNITPNHDDSGSSLGIGLDYHGSGFYENEVIHAAFLFTNEREEQIRQVRQEITRLEGIIWNEDNWRDYLEGWAGDDSAETHDAIREAVRQQCADIRILAREQAALDDLLRGWKGGK